MATKRITFPPKEIPKGYPDGLNEMDNPANLKPTELQDGWDYRLDAKR